MEGSAWHGRRPDRQGTSPLNGKHRLEYHSSCAETFVACKKPIASSPETTWPELTLLAPGRSIEPLPANSHCLLNCSLDFAVELTNGLRLNLLRCAWHVKLLRYSHARIHNFGWDRVGECAFLQFRQLRDQSAPKNVVATESLTQRCCWQSHIELECVDWVCEPPAVLVSKVVDSRFDSV